MVEQFNCISIIASGKYILNYELALLLKSKYILNYVVGNYEPSE